MSSEKSLWSKMYSPTRSSGRTTWRIKKWSASQLKFFFAIFAFSNFGFISLYVAVCHPVRGEERFLKSESKCPLGRFKKPGSLKSPYAACDFENVFKYHFITRGSHLSCCFGTMNALAWSFNSTEKNWSLAEPVCSLSVLQGCFPF